jgi:hypothetical protein
MDNCNCKEYRWSVKNKHRACICLHTAEHHKRAVIGVLV